MKKTRTFYLSEAPTMEEEVSNGDNGKGRRGKELAAKNINMVEYWVHFKRRLQEDKVF